MNDFYGYVVHQDRMGDMRREAEASRRAAQRPRAQRPRQHPVRRRIAAGIAMAVLAGIFVLVTSAPDAAGSGGPVPRFQFTDLVVTLGF